MDLNVLKMDVKFIKNIVPPLVLPVVPLTLLFPESKVNFTSIKYLPSDSFEDSRGWLLAFPSCFIAFVWKS